MITKKELKRLLAEAQADNDILIDDKRSNNRVIDDLTRRLAYEHSERVEAEAQRDFLKRDMTRLCAANAELAGALKKANAKLRSIVNTIHPDIVDGRAVVPNFKSLLNTDEGDA